MTLGAGEVRRLLDSHGISPSKALGQNFVVDPNTISRMVQLAGVGPGAQVVEVGPGVGSLTLGLAQAGASVLAVEFDRHLLPALNEVIAQHAVHVVHADAMEVDWSSPLALATSAPVASAVPMWLSKPLQPELSEQHIGWKLVANLPYNISAPLILNVLEQAPWVSEIHVMVQREVADRMAASVGGKEYGIPSVMRAYWASAQVVAKVPPTVFHPAPRVDSAILSVVRHAQPLQVPPVDRVRPLVQQAFGQRRKMLRKSLGGRVTVEAFEAAGIAPTQRPEELTIQDWCGLAAAVGAQK